MRHVTRSQSYKHYYCVITTIFGITYATFLRTNLSVEINAKINAENVFCCNSDSTKQIYRIEKVVNLKYADAKIADAKILALA
jgi:hypothetical protein